MAEAAAEKSGKGRESRFRTMLVICGLLLLEAAGIVGVMMLVGGEPDDARAGAMSGDPEQAAQDKVVEVLVLDDRLPNARTGITFLYDTEIYVQVKQKHSPPVQEELDQFYNEIRAEMSAIWRTSDPKHFQEPKLETLTRKVTALLQKRFGVDEETGEPILHKCVIVMGTGFRVDS